MIDESLTAATAAQAEMLKLAETLDPEARYTVLLITSTMFNFLGAPVSPRLRDQVAAGPPEGASFLHALLQHTFPPANPESLGDIDLLIGFAGTVPLAGLMVFHTAHSIAAQLADNPAIAAQMGGPVRTTDQIKNTILGSILFGFVTRVMEIDHNMVLSLLNSVIGSEVFSPNQPNTEHDAEEHQ